MQRRSWRTERLWKRVRAPALLGILTTLAITFCGPMLMGWRYSNVGHHDSLRWRIRSPIWSFMSAIFQSPDEAPAPNTPAAASLFETLRTTDYADGPGPLVNPEPPFVIWRYFESGWPLAAAYGWEHHAYLTPDPQTSRAGLVELPPLRLPQRRLSIPYLPHWRGIVANSVFFAVCWWLVLLAVNTTRRHIHRRILNRRGRCPACGYDLRGLPEHSPCPECGGQPRQQAARP